MLGKTLFLSLGLIAAMTLGCEKKSETPAVPDTAEVEDAANAAAADGDAAMDDAAKKVEEAADKAGDAADAVEDAAKDVKLPE